jgi:hypothetical protein
MMDLQKEKKVKNIDLEDFIKDDNELTLINVTLAEMILSNNEIDYINDKRDYKNRNTRVNLINSDSVRSNLGVDKLNHLYIINKNIKAIKLEMEGKHDYYNEQLTLGRNREEERVKRGERGFFEMYLENEEKVIVRQENSLMRLEKLAGEERMFGRPEKFDLHSFEFEFPKNSKLKSLMREIYKLEYTGMDLNMLLFKTVGKEGRFRLNIEQVYNLYLASFCHIYKEVEGDFLGEPVVYEIGSKEFLNTVVKNPDLEVHLTRGKCALNVMFSEKTNSSWPIYLSYLSLVFSLIYDKNYNLYFNIIILLTEIYRRVFISIYNYAYSKAVTFIKVYSIQIFGRSFYNLLFSFLSSISNDWRFCDKENGLMFLKMGCILPNPLGDITGFRRVENKELINLIKIKKDLFEDIRTSNEWTVVLEGLYGAKPLIFKCVKKVFLIETTTVKVILKISWENQNYGLKEGVEISSCCDGPSNIGLLFSDLRGKFLDASLYLVFKSLPIVYINKGFMHLANREDDSKDSNLWNSLGEGLFKNRVNYIMEKDEKIIVMGSEEHNLIEEMVARVFPMAGCKGGSNILRDFFVELKRRYLNDVEFKEFYKELVKTFKNMRVAKSTITGNSNWKKVTYLMNATLSELLGVRLANITMPYLNKFDKRFIEGVQARIERFKKSNTEGVHLEKSSKIRNELKNKLTESCSRLNKKVAEIQANGINKKLEEILKMCDDENKKLALDMMSNCENEVKIKKSLYSEKNIIDLYYEVCSMNDVPEMFKRFGMKIVDRGDYNYVYVKHKFGGFEVNRGTKQLELLEEIIYQNDKDTLKEEGEKRKKEKEKELNKSEEEDIGSCSGLGSMFDFDSGGFESDELASTSKVGSEILNPVVESSKYEQMIKIGELDIDLNSLVENYVRTPGFDPPNLVSLKLKSSGPITNTNKGEEVTKSAKKEKEKEGQSGGDKKILNIKEKEKGKEQEKEKEKEKEKGRKTEEKEADQKFLAECKEQYESGLVLSGEDFKMFEGSVLESLRRQASSKEVNERTIEIRNKRLKRFESGVVKVHELASDPDFYFVKGMNYFKGREIHKRILEMLNLFLKEVALAKSNKALACARELRKSEAEIQKQTSELNKVQPLIKKKNKIEVEMEVRSVEGIWINPTKKSSRNKAISTKSDQIVVKNHFQALMSKLIDEVDVVAQDVKDSIYGITNLVDFSKKKRKAGPVKDGKRQKKWGKGQGSLLENLNISSEFESVYFDNDLGMDEIYFSEFQPKKKKKEGKKGKCEPKDKNRNKNNKGKLSNRNLLKQNFKEVTFKKLNYMSCTKSLPDLLLKLEDCVSKSTGKITETKEEDGKSTEALLKCSFENSVEYLKLRNEINELLSDFNNPLFKSKYRLKLLEIGNLIKNGNYKDPGVYEELKNLLKRHENPSTKDKISTINNRASTLMALSVGFINNDKVLQSISDCYHADKSLLYKDLKSRCDKEVKLEMDNLLVKLGSYKSIRNLIRSSMGSKQEIESSYLTNRKKS